MKVDNFFKDVVKSLESSGKQISSAFSGIRSELQPLFDKISYEYSVDQKEFERSSKRLMKQGYFLPLTSTPRDYIRMDKECEDDEDLERYYIDFLEEREVIIDLIDAFGNEEMSKEWHEPIETSRQLIENLGIDSSYSLVLSFYYAFSEFLIRNKFEKKGKNLGKTKKLFQRTKRNILSYENINSQTKKYYTYIVSEFYEYFFDSFKEPEDVARNSVLHGYSTPIKWRKVDFYKLMSGISLLIYILV